MSDHRLWQPEAPFLLTLLIGILAWSTARFIEINADSPLVVYKQNLSRCDGGEICFTVELQNLSQRDRFSGLQFAFIQSGTGKATFSEPSTIIHPPYWDATPEIGSPARDVNFNIAEFPPGAEITLQAKYSGTTAPSFHLLKSTEPMQLRKSSPLTWVVGHQGWMLGGLWFLSCPILMYYYSKTTRRTLKQLKELKQSNRREANFDSSKSNSISTLDDAPNSASSSTARNDQHQIDRQ